MSIKAVGSFVVTWSIAAVLGARPAHAIIATKLLSTDDFVEVSAHHESLTYTPSICGGVFPVYYQQRMTLDEAGTDMVFTDFVYSPGRKELTLIAACDDGYYIYGVGPCEC
jgi:hypothetical protein